MIKINDLTFGYPQRYDIFSTLELNLGRGRIYGLLGKNGSGKSTLLKLISGMVYPRSGNITTLGVKPTDRLPSFMSNIYYLTEEIFVPNESMETYSKFLSPFYPKFSFDDLERLMTVFELDREQNLTSMSLGQKKKATIALALACNTDLVIMDEPTNGLDIPSKSQFRKIISSIATDERCIIISTHQVRDLENLIDSVVVLDNSKIVVNSTLHNISQKLSFRAIAEGEKSIYEESNMMGRWGVVENTDTDEYSKVDIEVLFNAAVAQPELIGEILNK